MIRCPSRGLDMRSNRITLTPRLFRKLDVIARRHGAVLEVKRRDRLGCFGLWPGVVGEVFVDKHATEGVGVCSDAAVVQIANYIDVDEFQSSQRPELDYCKVEINQIYPLIVYHELGHILENYLMWHVHVAAESPRSLLPKVARTLNEVLADRFAWRQLYPMVPLPKHSEIDEEHLRASFRLMAERGFTISKLRPKPISTRLEFYVPVGHVRHAIPWATQAGSSKGVIACL